MSCFEIGAGVKIVKKLVCAFGQIHLVHLWIHKYFMDDSSVNFHDKVFLHFWKKNWQKMKENLVMEIYG